MLTHSGMRPSHTKTHIHTHHASWFPLPSLPFLSHLPSSVWMDRSMHTSPQLRTHPCSYIRAMQRLTNQIIIVTGHTLWEDRGQWSSVANQWTDAGMNLDRGHGDTHGSVWVLVWSVCTRRPPVLQVLNFLSQAASLGLQLCGLLSPLVLCDFVKCPNHTFHWTLSPTNDASVLNVLQDYCHPRTAVVRAGTTLLWTPGFMNKRWIFLDSTGVYFSSLGLKIQLQVCFEMK